MSKTAEKRGRIQPSPCRGKKQCAEDMPDDVSIPDFDDKLVEVSKAIYDSLAKTVEDRETALVARIGALIETTVQDRLKARFEIAEASFGVHVDALREEIGRIREQLKAVREEAARERTQMLGQIQRLLQDLLANAPPPQIMIPPDAIRVNVQQEPSVVHMNVPTPSVTIPKNAIKVLVEEGQRVKHITYDEQGRPKTIEEYVTPN